MKKILFGVAALGVATITGISAIANKTDNILVNAAEVLSKEMTIYLNTDGCDWISNPSVIYTLSDKSTGSVKMTAASGTHNYSAELPSDVESVIFRHNNVEDANCNTQSLELYETARGLANYYKITSQSTILNGYWDYWYDGAGLIGGDTLYVQTPAIWGNKDKKIAVYFFDGWKGGVEVDAQFGAEFMTPISESIDRLYKITVPGDSSTKWYKSIVVNDTEKGSIGWTGMNYDQTTDIRPLAYYNESPLIVVSSTQESDKYVAGFSNKFDEDELKAIEWGATFLSNVTCDDEGSMTGKSGFWGNGKDAYTALDASAKFIVGSTEGKRYEGTALEQAVDRYDYICGKYNTAEVKNYEEYISGRTITYGSNAIGIFRTESFVQQTPAVLIAAIVSVAFVGIFVGVKVKSSKSDD